MKMIIEESKRSALKETQRLNEVIEELRRESSTLRYSSSKLEKANQELVTQLAQRTEDCDRTIK
jgi:phage shock protein A